jgi:hypothetical protein
MMILDLDHYRNEFSKEMESLREAVLSGNRQAIFKAIEFYFRGVSGGWAGPCPSWLADFAAIPFNEFAEGKHQHLEHAFGFKIKITEPTRLQRIYGREIYEEIQSLIHSPRFKNRKNITIKDAFQKTGNKFNMSPGRIQDIYYGYKERLSKNSHDHSHELRENILRKYKKS